MTVKDEFIHIFSRIGKQWGIGEPAGKIWGLLLFEKKALTQKEIAKKTNYSLSLVSPSLKILEKLGKVSIIGKKKKEKLYSSSISFIDSFERFLKDFNENHIKPITSLLVSGLQNNGDKQSRTRLNELLKEYHDATELIKESSKAFSSKKPGVSKQIIS